MLGRLKKFIVGTIKLCFISLPARFLMFYFMENIDNLLMQNIFIITMGYYYKFSKKRN